MAEISPLATQQQILDLIQAQREVRAAAFQQQQDQTRSINANSAAALQRDAEIAQAILDETTDRLDYIDQIREEQLQADLARLNLDRLETGNDVPDRSEEQPLIQPPEQEQPQIQPRGSLVDIFA
ncbi:MAG: hypothetical protein OEY85_04080 [Rhodospirillales bacterium]|nr:hypothetical protein [Rhodospirillales bacterium]